MLGKIVSENQRDWDTMYVLAAYNATEHSATGYTPNMLVFGRELRFPNKLMYTDVDDKDISSISSVEFMAERQAMFKKAFALACDTIRRAAERSKKRYDMRVKTAAYQVEDWVYYFCPRHRVGRSPKWQRFYSGPFLVIGKLGAVNLRTQRSPRANNMIVHVDKVKHCTRTTPVSWLGTTDYHVLPSALELDALPMLFGGVDRSSPKETDPNLVVKPKRNGAMPARFFCGIFAVPNDISLSHVIYKQRCDCVTDDIVCLCFVSEMKKTGYNCFPC